MGISRSGYIYKAFKFLGIKAESKHQVHYKPRKVKDKYPNLIFTTWETVDRPRQVIVSDMTAFKVWFFYIEVTFYFDVFTKQILTLKIAERRGDRRQYIELIKDENIVGSMSRAGKPTDNPVNESLNGWIKEEIYIDFKIEKCRDKDEVVEIIKRYVKYYNSQRPCFSLGYDTPDNYYRRFRNGEIEKKDTFSKRELTEIPKFVQKKMKKNENTEK